MNEHALLDLCSRFSLCFVILLLLLLLGLEIRVSYFGISPIHTRCPLRQRQWQTKEDLRGVVASLHVLLTGIYVVWYLPTFMGLKLCSSNVI